MLEKNKKPIRIKLAAIAKDEAAYIPLWVYHHLRFGFDSIDVWINASNDNSIKILEKIKEKNHIKINFFDADDFLKNYYPPAISSDWYRIIVERELEKVYNFLKDKFEIEKKEKTLRRITISNRDGMTAESLSYVGAVTRDNKTVEGYEKVSGGLAAILENENA